MNNPQTYSTLATPDHTHANKTVEQLGEQLVQQDSELERLAQVRLVPCRSSTSTSSQPEHDPYATLNLVKTHFLVSNPYLRPPRTLKS